MFEDVDLNETDVSRGVKFVISGVNWTMCRPNVDDYNYAISRLMQGMRDKGVILQQIDVTITKHCVLHVCRIISCSTQGAQVKMGFEVMGGINIGAGVSDRAALLLGGWCTHADGFLTSAKSYSVRSYTCDKVWGGIVCTFMYVCMHIYIYISMTVFVNKYIHTGIVLHNVLI